MCDKETDEDKETSIAYDIKGKEKTSSTTENKENSIYGCVCMY